VDGFVLTPAGVGDAIMSDAALLRPPRGPNAGAPAVTLDSVVFRDGEPTVATVRLGGPTSAVDAVIFALMTDPFRERLERLFTLNGGDRRARLHRRRSADRAEPWAVGRDPIEVVAARNTLVRGRPHTVATLRVRIDVSPGDGRASCFEILGHPIRVEDGQMLAVRVVGPRRLCAQARDRSAAAVTSAR
jgi:hypothetical protein